MAEKERQYRAVEPMTRAEAEAILEGSDESQKTDALISMGFYGEPVRWVIDTCSPLVFAEEKWVSHCAALALLYVGMRDEASRPELHERAVTMLGSDLPEMVRSTLEELEELTTAPRRRWWARWRLRG